VIAEVVPPEQLRLLFLRPRPNQAIEFDPDGTDAIPRLFDEFDRLAAATAGREVKGSLPPSPESVFRYSLLAPDADVAGEATAYRPSFGHVATLVQVKPIEPDTFAAEKGSSLTPRERDIAAERIAAARRWLETYAPETARFVVQVDALPAAAAELDAEQRGYLAALADSIAADRPAAGDAWQARIFSVAAGRGVANGRAFEAIYRAVLGRTNGPRAGWLLAGLDPGFVIGRLHEAGHMSDGR
jgi:lysyl-tRNA synthetase class 1